MSSYELPRETKAVGKCFRRQVKYDQAGNWIETIELVLHDKLAALAQLTQYLGPSNNEVLPNHTPLGVNIMEGNLPDVPRI